MKARLILENGVIFEGKAFGHLREIVGEVVFNTSMTGYQEIITDPANHGQIITMTYPLIGNYGINLDDMESDGAKIKGLIVREKADFPSNWRNEMELHGYMKQNRVLGLEGIDTRALTKIIRDNGTMVGIITLRELPPSQIEQKFETYHNKGAVEQVSLAEKYTIDGSGKHLAIVDFGIKRSIINILKSMGFKLTIYPFNTSNEEILMDNPDGIILSAGPGNPKDSSEIINNIKGLLDKKPILGFGLGHQLLVLGLDGDTEKLKYGHRGSNHPVKDLFNNRILITSQNHGYVVNEDLPENLVVTYRNINDGTIEGFKHKILPIMGVQFSPEAYIFEEFIGMLGGFEDAKR